MIKKSTVIKLAIVAELMSAFTIGEQYTNTNIFTPQTVEASRKYKIKLIHNAYTYNYRGKRRGKRVLKKGKVYTAYRTKRINHKKYYYLGHHNYIKAANAKTYKKAASKYLFKVDVTGAGFVYPTFKDTGNSNIAIGGLRKVYKEAKDTKGTTWYMIGNNKWIISTDTNKPKITKSSTNSAMNKANNRNNKKVQYNISTEEYAKSVEQAFINKINALRISRGTQPFVEDKQLNDYAKIRANEANTLFEHIRPNGERTKYGEVLEGGAAGVYESPEQVAQQLFKDFIYHDSGSNWQHRDLLLNGSYVHIGAGLAWDTKDMDSTYAGFTFIANFY